MNERYAEAFETWKARYDENPRMFESHAAFKAKPPKTYGEAAARYFESVLTEIEQATDHSLPADYAESAE